MDEIIRWAVKVSGSTDTLVRSYLALKGLKKGHQSKVIEYAVRWRMFRQTVRDTGERNANAPQEEHDAAIEEALTAQRLPPLFPGTPRHNAGTPNPRWGTCTAQPLAVHLSRFMPISVCLTRNCFFTNGTSW
jgi:Ribbon-helix-helix domain